MKEQQEAMLYEGMYVLNAMLNDEARTKAFEKIKDSITARGGEIVKVHDQGRRRLAYEIRKQREGYYYLLYFRLPTLEIQDLWNEYQLNEHLLRFLTLRTDNVLEEVNFKQLPEQ